MSQLCTSFPEATEDTMRGPIEDRTTGTKCYQCGSESPDSGFTEHVVIHRKWDAARGKQYVGRTKFTVCAGTQCGPHCQMSHEG